jgi:glutaredoxin
MTKPLVEVYSSNDCNSCLCAQGDNCSLCADASEVITRVGNDIPLELKEVDIRSSEDLLRRYSGGIPTIFINGKKAFKFKVDEAEFRRRTRKELIKASMMRLRAKKAEQL